jgi:ribonuclease HI
MDTRSNLESLYPYPDNIFIQDRLLAIQYGHYIFEQGMIERCLVLWVDGSVERFPRVKEAKRLTAAAVRYLDFSSKNWVELVTLNTLPYGSKFALEAEIIAIREAFRKACELNNDFDRLLIFTDCQSILQGIQSKSTFSFLSDRDLITSLFMYANMLYNVGITVELRWVPAHSSVEGNERVDELAKRFRRAARSILAKEQPELILRYVTISPSSEELLRQVLFQKAQQRSEEHVRTSQSKLIDSRILVLRWEL